MEFSEVVKSRRSIRKFTDKLVPEEVIEQGLTEALLAPNTSNLQPWEFYWVRTANKKKLVVEACFNQSTAKTAQELIVVVANVKAWKRNRLLLLEELKKNKNTPASVLSYYEKLIPVIYTQGPLSLFGYLKTLLAWGFGWFKVLPRYPNSHAELSESLVKSVALACQNFMLSMTAQGYGTCAMEGFDSSRLKKIVGLRREHQIVMVISVGEPAEDGIWGAQMRLSRDLFIKYI